MAGCGAFTADAPALRVAPALATARRPVAPRCRQAAARATPTSCVAAALLCGLGGTPFYGCEGASTEGDARAIDLSAVLYRGAQRLWQTYKNAFGGGNATAPEGAAGRRAGRTAERRAARQMLEAEAEGRLRLQ